MAANPFESGRRKVIPAVLIYAWNAGRFLLIHRNTGAGALREADYHEGRWNGLGGKLELDESPREAARREFAEESGLELEESRFRALGRMDFPNFKAHKGEDWSVSVFRVRLTDEEAARAAARSAEGDLHWVPESKMDELNFWPGDREFLPHVLAQRPFIGTIWYAGPEVRRSWIEVL